VTGAGAGAGTGAGAGRGAGAGAGNYLGVVLGIPKMAGILIFCGGE